jgi:hypothetical protein
MEAENMKHTHRSTSIKKLSIGLTILLTGSMFQEQALATAINVIQSGSVAINGPAVDGTVSYAVISGTDFNAELATHNIGFFGSVPSGTLGPIAAPANSDFVYLYQLVNDGPNTNAISSWTIGVGSASGLITNGGRLESTLFVDPGVGLVSAGVAGATTGLTGGPTVDFQNGLGGAFPTDPVPTWGPCLGSGPAGVQCSDGQADLLPSSIQVTNWQETPSGTSGGIALLDAGWSSSIIWFSSPFGPISGFTSIQDGGTAMTGIVPVPGIPVPAAVWLFGSGLLGLVGVARRKKA